MDKVIVEEKKEQKIEKPAEVGLRFNEGKIRYDLLEPFAIEQVAKVFTMGAKKYAPFNWLKGMPWSSMVASMKRHIAAFENGEDFDPESGLYHLAHAAWNALALVSYYKYFPQGDDRIHTLIKQPRIALDIDDVICDWVTAWSEMNGMPLPTAWQFDRAIIEKFDTMRYKGDLDDFYLKLKMKTHPEDIPFEPIAYVTARPVDSFITEEWLDVCGFPAAPVYTVGVGQSKLDVLKKIGADIFVDDNYTTFRELNKNGICCYLMDAPHNQRYNVGYKRIKSLKDLQIA